MLLFTRLQLEAHKLFMPEHLHHDINTETNYMLTHR